MKIKINRSRPRHAVNREFIDHIWSIHSFDKKCKTPKGWPPENLVEWNNHL